MSIKQTFTQADIEENERMLNEEMSQDEQPLSDEDSALIKKLYIQYEERLENAHNQEQWDRYQHQRNQHELTEIGRRK